MYVAITCLNYHDFISSAFCLAASFRVIWAAEALSEVGLLLSNHLFTVYKVSSYS